jgi:hypothetical protein
MNQSVRRLRSEKLQLNGEAFPEMLSGIESVRLRIKSGSAAFDADAANVHTLLEENMRSTGAR